PLDGVEALKNTLGVIDSIHADAEQGGFNTEFGAQSSALFARVLETVKLIFIGRKGNADGIGANPGGVALAVDREAIPFGECFQRAVHRLQEVVAMRLNVKTDQVSAKEAVDEFALPRTNTEHFGIGPGDMPKNGHGGIGARFLDHPREKGKVIILGEKNGRLSSRHFLKDGIGKAAIDLLILEPVVKAECRAGVRDV